MVDDTPKPPKRAATPKPVSKSEEFRRTAIMLLALGFLSVVAFVAYSNRNSALVAEDVRRNFKVFFGMPVIAAVALVVVFVLRQKEGPMKVRLGLFQLSGSSGEAFVWLVIVIALSLVMNQLWVAG